MVLSTFFAHAFELVPLPKITSHLHLVGPIRATPATRSIAVTRVPITLGSPLRCSTWRQSKAGASMSCMCATTRENLTFASRKTINLRTSERRPSTLAYKLARVSARATSASTCLFANRLHALASKDMYAKPMTPKIQVAVELPATLMLLGDTEVPAPVHAHLCDHNSGLLKLPAPPAELPARPHVRVSATLKHRAGSLHSSLSKIVSPAPAGEPP